MPSYYEGSLCVYSDIDSGAREIGKFHIKAKPLGKRGMKGLSWLPYTTGSKPKFRYEIRCVNQPLTGAFGITLSRVFSGKEEILRLTNDNLQGHYEENFEDNFMIAHSGEYLYKLDIQVSVFSSYVEIVAFKAKAQEDVTMFVFNILGVLLGGIIGAFVMWLFTKGK